MTPVPTSKTETSKYLEAAATVSPCGKYRYDLTRVWDGTLNRVAFAMLNPSTADGAQDDPTIRRCVGFAKAWGYGSLVVVNLFALRATDPECLVGASDPVGPDNDAVIEAHCSGRMVVAAWGANPAKWKRPTLRTRPAEVLQLLSRIGSVCRHLGLSKGGLPKHPLYLKSECVPTPFPGRT